MLPDEVYGLCLPVLRDSELEQDEKTDKVEELLHQGLSLAGKPLENAVLDVLWRYREAKAPSAYTPPVRHTIVRQVSPAPWQIPRASTPIASPALSRTSPAPPPGFGVVPPSFLRPRSHGGASPFSSPRPSPRLAFASPIPHSPSLSTYKSSEPTTEGNDYGDYGSDTVEWLTNEGSNSRPSSAGAGSASENGLNGAASAWIPKSNDMSPYDMLRSIMGGGKTDEEIESALEANGYDLSATVMNLMEAQNGSGRQDQSYFADQDRNILIGKSMNPSQPIMIDQTERGRSSIICKYWLSNGSCLRADCRFSHDLSSHICKYAFTTLKSDLGTDVTGIG